MTLLKALNLVDFPMKGSTSIEGDDASGETPQRFYQKGENAEEQPANAADGRAIPDWPRFTGRYRAGSTRKKLLQTMVTFLTYRSTEYPMSDGGP